jgi:hypothetical protein
MKAAQAELARRIEAIEWDQDETRGRLHVQLVREYLRRAALWAQALEVTQEWPFFDVALAADPNVDTDLDTLRRVRQHLEDTKASWWATRIAEWALRFAALTSPYGLPDPYEPLLVMFEQGGDFTTEAGFVNVDFVIGLPIRSLHDHLSEEPVLDV